MYIKRGFYVPGQYGGRQAARKLSALGCMIWAPTESRVWTPDSAHRGCLGATPDTETQGFNKAEYKMHLKTRKECRNHSETLLNQKISKFCIETVSSKKIQLRKKKFDVERKKICFFFQIFYQEKI